MSAEKRPTIIISYPYLKSQTIWSKNIISTWSKTETNEKLYDWHLYHNTQNHSVTFDHLVKQTFSQLSIVPIMKIVMLDRTFAVQEKLLIPRTSLAVFRMIIIPITYWSGIGIQTVSPLMQNPRHWDSLSNKKHNYLSMSYHLTILLSVF